MKIPDGTDVSVSVSRHFQTIEYYIHSYNVLLINNVNKQLRS